MSLNFKSKGNSLVSVLTCNVLMAAYADEDNWPDDFVKVGVTVSIVYPHLQQFTSLQQHIQISLNHLFIIYLQKIS